MPTNNKEYQREYMREYNSKSPLEYCQICNRNFKIVNRRVHSRSATHKLLSKFIDSLKMI